MQSVRLTHWIYEQGLFNISGLMIPNARFPSIAFGLIPTFIY